MIGVVILTIAAIALAPIIIGGLLYLIIALIAGIWGSIENIFK